MPLETATGHSFHAGSGGKAPDFSGKSSFSYLPNESWRPNVNLYENDMAYIVCIDLAGVDKPEIDVVVEDQTLRIRGARAVPTPENYPEQQKPRIRVHLMEIDHGRFFREVELPADVEKDHITATHRNGMLWIELPKRRH
jgi:HSP20 family protein